MRNPNIGMVQPWVTVAIHRPWWTIGVLNVSVIGVNSREMVLESFWTSGEKETASINLSEGREHREKRGWQ